MIEVVTPDIAFLYRDKLDAMFALRHRVFHERLGWDVNARGGRERDVYDLHNPVYLLATDDHGTVQGTWRLLPTTGPYMLRDVFGDVFTDVSKPADPFVWEISRFAVEPGPGGEDRRGTLNRLTSELFIGLVEWALLFGIREVVTVHDVRVARLLNHLGVRPKWASARHRIGATVAVTGGFEVSDEVLDNIRAATGVTGSVLADQRNREVLHAA